MFGDKNFFLCSFDFDSVSDEYVKAYYGMYVWIVGKCHLNKTCLVQLDHTVRPASYEVRARTYALVAGATREWRYPPLTR